MSNSPSLSTGMRVGGTGVEMRAQSGLDINCLTIVEAVEHREIMRRSFDVYCTAWNTTDNTMLTATYYKLMRQTEEEIQLCDLRIARLIETQGSYRLERMNDEDIPF